MLSGDLPSLRTLSLAGDMIRLPQKKMSSLRDFGLSSAPGAFTVTQILDFLESAPLLHTIDIKGLISTPFDALPERIVTLGHLHTLIINADSVYCIFKHLHIPVGASVRMWATFTGEALPLLEYLRGTSPNTKNLSHISAVNLCFGSKNKHVKLSGPSGSLCVSGHRKNPATPSTTTDRGILRALSPHILSTTEQLTVSYYAHRDLANIEECLVSQTLRSMNNLQSFALTQCDSQPFIFALNPEKNSSEAVLCPNLKKLVLCGRSWGPTNDLVDMAKGRALRGARLSSVTIVSLGSTGTPVRETEILGLREHVTQVEHMIDTIPSWEYLPDETGDRWG